MRLKRKVYNGDGCAGNCDRCSDFTHICGVGHDYDARAWHRAGLGQPE